MGTDGLSDLERLAASVLCVGFPGDSPEAVPLETLRTLRPGGFVLFARNVSMPEGTRALVDALCAVAYDAGDPVAPLVAIDQEGGRVARLQRGAVIFPSAMAVGACADAALAERVGLALASELRRCGVSLDFAPVADLALAAESGVIGTRAFSDDPADAAACVAALVRGLQRGGVGATLKHFPGHGASAADSHLTLPSLDVSLETLRARELVPFRAGIAAGADAVMAGHVLLPALDAARPASLSPRILVELLRDELGFEGVCFTDCLEMDALAGWPGGVPGAALAALAAGADGLVISHRLELAVAARDAIVAAVVAGALPRARLEQAAARMLALRVRLERSAPESERDPAAVAALVAHEALTLVRGSVPELAGRVVNVVSFEGAKADGVGSRVASHSALHLALRTRRVRGESLRVPLEPDELALEALLELIAAQPERPLVILTRRALVHAAQAHAVDALLAVAPDALLVAALEPFDVARFPQARNVACTYGDDEPSFEALADVLAGRAVARGRLPVTLALVSA